MPNKKEEELVMNCKEWCQKPAPNFDVLNVAVTPIDFNIKNDDHTDIDRK